MKIYELFESNAEGSFDNDKFEKDCAFYLKLMGKNASNTFMWRGTESEIKSGTIKPFRPRRQPMAIPQKTHDEVNEFFEEKFGKPFRNGLFVTGERYGASMYGPEHIIVPIGQFEWLSSTTVGDLYIDGIATKVDDEGDEEEVAKAGEKLVKKIKGSKGWIHNTNFLRCVRAQKEIMLWCPDGYYMFDPDQEISEDEALPRALTIQRKPLTLMGRGR